MTDRELMQQALETLVDLMGWQTLAPADTQRTAHKAITALRERLAQPDPMPLFDDWNKDWQK